MIYKKIQAKNLKTGMSIKTSFCASLKITDVQKVSRRVIAAAYKFDCSEYALYFIHAELVEVEAGQAAG